MAPIVVAPSDWDLRDLAAHYAYLPRKTPTSSERVAEAPSIVATGMPRRNIALCGSCPGRPDTKPGGAWLRVNPSPISRVSSKHVRVASATATSMP
ncbi:MAG TPA: hypothetical protein VNR89_10905 [Roseomonas sp.]|nr:hypothetical protein [Roseomonas sp.]